MNENYITTKEAGLLIGITPESVSRLCRKKVIEGQKWGTPWFVLKSSAEAYAESVKGKSPQDWTRINGYRGGE